MSTQTVLAPRHATPTLDVAVADAQPYKARYLLAVARIAMGWMFLWDFLDKTFGLSFATDRADAWLDGGSPTFGFLSSGTEGKLFHEFFAGLAGPAADWLFMTGLLGLGIALTLGIGMRIAAVTGGLLLILIWAAELPLEYDPFLDAHLIHTVLLAALAVSGAGRTWGFGRAWENLPLVQRLPFLK